MYAGKRSYIIDICIIHVFILCVQCRPFMQRVICAEFELLKSANGAKSSRPKGLIPRPPVSNVTFGRISWYYKVVPSLTGTNMDVGEQRLNWFGLLGARKFWISFTVWNKMKLWSYLAECLLLKTHLAPFGFHNLPCNLGKSTQSTFTNTNKEVKRILKH